MALPPKGQVPDQLIEAFKEAAIHGRSTVMLGLLGPSGEAYRVIPGELTFVKPRTELALWEGADHAIAG